MKASAYSRSMLAPLKGWDRRGILVRVRELTVGAPSEACVQVQVGLHVVAVDVLALGVHQYSATRFANEVVDVKVVARVEVALGSGTGAEEAEGCEGGDGTDLHVD